MKKENHNMKERISKVILSNLCAVFDDKGNVLVQYREKKDWPGYTFPGGHIEPDETIENSVRREMKEETGLEIGELTLCGVMEWPWEGNARYLAFLYGTRDYQGDVISSEEGKISWVPVEDLPHLELSQDMDKLIEIAYQGMKISGC